MSTAPTLDASRRFAVALSFPGEHRGFVERIADHLAYTFGKDRVLYDKYHEAEFARLDLDCHLPVLYRDHTDLVVVFLCEQYAAKRWCNLEWRHIRDLIQTKDAHRIMLVSFGNPGDLAHSGIVKGDSYLDVGGRPAQDIAEKILERYRLTRGEAVLAQTALHRDPYWLRLLAAVALALGFAAVVVVAIVRSIGNCDSASLGAFPQLGCAEVIENKVNAVMRHRPISCHGDCLPRVDKAVEIRSVLEASGFGVLVFKKQDATEPLDASNMLVRLRIVQGSKKFEVGVMDRSSRIAFLHCEAPTLHRAYDYLLRFPVEDLERASCRMVPQDAIQVSVGFSTGSGSGTGDHVMQVLGVQALDSSYSVPTDWPIACRLASCRPVGEHIRQ